MKFLRIVYILMPAAIVLAFMYAPSAHILGDLSRVIYFHVPIAWVSILAFLVAGVLSILFLFRGREKFAHLERWAYHSSIIGMICSVLTVITGSIWAKFSWGVYWNWDPRETSIVFVLTIYIAYFCLRFALQGKENGAKIVSSYLIIAMAVLPFFIFIWPRIFQSLHPVTIINVEGKVHLEKPMRITLLISLVSFTVLYFYLLNLMNRISLISLRIEEYFDERD